MDRKRDHRGRDKERSKRSRSRTRSLTPDHARSRPNPCRTRSPSADRRRSRSNRRNRHHPCPTPESPPLQPQQRRDDEAEKENDGHRAPVGLELDHGNMKENHQKKKKKKMKERGGSEGSGEENNAVVDANADVDEIEMMKKLGIPVGFDSTKGKPVLGNDVVGAVRKVTKWLQPRQYMNRPRGFNCPLPAQRNT